MIALSKDIQRSPSKINAEKKEEHIVSYTAEELDEMIARGESQTDWHKVRCMTDEDIEQNADMDLESPPYPY